MTKVAEIFEENVVIHPNMNSLVKKEFNNSRIQELLRMGTFNGEALDNDTLLSRSIVDLNIVNQRTSAIQILSLRETDGESLRVKFKFLETPFAQEIKQIYINSPQSFKLRPRAFTDSGQMIFFLITFDLIANFLFREIGTMEEMIMRNKMFRKPYVIVIEGLDGTGKETSTKGLKALLESRGYKVKMVSFPMYHKWHAFLVSFFLKGKFGNSPYSVSPRIASLFYSIDRFFGYHFGIKKDMKAEAEATGHPYNFLIFDRYSTSNMLYQGAKGKTIAKGLKIAKFVDFVEHTLFRLPRPNKIYTLISSAEQSRDGMKNRETLDILEKDLDYQHKVRRFMNTLIMEYKWFPVATREEEAPYDWYHVEDIAEVMYAFIDYWALIKDNRQQDYEWVTGSITAKEIKDSK